MSMQAGPFSKLRGVIFREFGRDLMRETFNDAGFGARLK